MEEESTVKWYYASRSQASSNDRQGPVTQVALEDLIRQGIVSDKHLVWRQGMKEWAKSRKTPEFAKFFPATEKKSRKSKFPVKMITPAEKAAANPTESNATKTADATSSTKPKKESSNAAAEDFEDDLPAASSSAPLTTEEYLASLSESKKQASSDDITITMLEDTVQFDLVGFQSEMQDQKMRSSVSERHPSLAEVKDLQQTAKHKSAFENRVSSRLPFFSMDTTRVCKNLAVSAQMVAIPWKDSSKVVLAPIRRGVIASSYLNLASSYVAATTAGEHSLTDLAFHPFDATLLTTSATDGFVKLWSIPSALPLQSHLTKPMASLSVADAADEYSNLLHYHPNVNNLLATVTNLHRIRIWNLDAQTNPITLYGNTKTVTDVNWSSSGGLICSIAQDNQIRVFDPRDSSNCVSQVTFNGLASYQSRVCWLDGTQKDESKTMLSMTFNASTLQRDLTIWDSRNLQSPVSVVRMESSHSESGQAVPFFMFDRGAKVLTVAGKGGKTSHFYRYMNDQLKHVGNHTWKSSHHGMTVFQGNGNAPSYLYRMSLHRGCDSNEILGLRRPMSTEEADNARRALDSVSIQSAREWFIDEMPIELDVTQAEAEEMASVKVRQNATTANTKIKLRKRPKAKPIGDAKVSELEDDVSEPTLQTVVETDEDDSLSLDDVTRHRRVIVHTSGKMTDRADSTPAPSISNTSVRLSSSAQSINLVDQSLFDGFDESFHRDSALTTTLRPPRMHVRATTMDRLYPIEKDADVVIPSVPVRQTPTPAEEKVEEKQENRQHSTMSLVENNHLRQQALAIQEQLDSALKTTRDYAREVQNLYRENVELKAQHARINLQKHRSHAVNVKERDAFLEGLNPDVVNRHMNIAEQEYRFELTHRHITSRCQKFPDASFADFQKLHNLLYMEMTWSQN